MAIVARVTMAVMALHFTGVAMAQDNTMVTPPLEVYPASGGGSSNPVFYPRNGNFYASVHGGVLGLSLPGFNFFQELDQGFNQLQYLETDDGLEPAGMIGGAIGLFSGERYGFEARGFYSQHDTANNKVFVDTPDTRIAFADIDGGSIGFTGATGVELATTTARDVEFGNFDLLARYDVWAGQLLVVSSYAGYSMIQLDQTFSVSGRGFAPDGSPTGDVVNLNEDLGASYNGFLLGFEMWRALGSFTTLGLDGSLGCYRLETERNASEETFGPGLLDRSVALSQRQHGNAVSARLRVELIRHFGWCDLSVFGSLNYLSDVPFVQYGRITPGNAPASVLTTAEAGWYTAGLQFKVPF